MFSQENYPSRKWLKRVIYERNNEYEDNETITTGTA